MNNIDEIISALQVARGNKSLNPFQSRSLQSLLVLFYDLKQVENRWRSAQLERDIYEVQLLRFNERIRYTLETLPINDGSNDTLVTIIEKILGFLGDHDYGMI